MKYIVFLLLFALNALKAQIEISTTNVLYYQYNANECIFDLINIIQIENEFKIYKEEIIVKSNDKTYRYIIVKDHLIDYIDKKAWYTEHNEKILYYIGKSILILYYNYNENTYRYDNYMIFYN